MKSFALMSFTTTSVLLPMLAAAAAPEPMGTVAALPTDAASDPAEAEDFDMLALATSEPAEAEDFDMLALALSTDAAMGYIYRALSKLNIK